MPKAIILDNGPEFRGRALAAWREERGVRLEFIQPGKPTQNARRKVETWRLDYNQQRPHSSLDYLSPAEFARKAAEMTA